MNDAGADSLSCWGEFEVRCDMFQSMQRRSRWGKAAGAAGYTVDLYASPLATQCKRYCAREAVAESAGGEPGCLGDARLVKLSDEDNVWACPPLTVVQTAVLTAVRSFMEMQVRGTIVVPSGKPKLGTASYGRGLLTLCRCHGSGQGLRW